MDGGGGDGMGTSTAPLTWHDFLERMRHPSAADFVKSIKSFIVSFSNRAPDPEKDSDSVQEFLVSMEGAFRAHALWAGSSEEELDSAGEGLEKYVMTKLYSRAFASLPEDIKHDDELFEKIALVQQFIRPEYLDIKPVFQNETSWLLAQKELQKINMYKAPRDKLVCILNCCKVINNLLLNAFMASNGDPPGADEFLPVLIYVVIKANPPQLYSNLLYIQRYRRQSRLVSEAAYFFTNLLSAESFIWNIDARSLSLDESEFERYMESARENLLGLSSNTGSLEKQINEVATEERVDKTKDKKGPDNYVRERSAPPQEYDLTKDVESKDQQLSDRPSITDLEKKGASELLNEDPLSRFFQEYPFLYAHSGDLTVADVENLLNSYKQLVFKYVSLSKGMGITNTSPTSQAQSKTETSDESAVVAEMENNVEYEGAVSNAPLFEGMSITDTTDTTPPAEITESHVKAETSSESKDTTEMELRSEEVEKNEGLRNTLSMEPSINLIETSSSDNLFSSFGDDKDSGLHREDSISNIGAGGAGVSE